MGWSGAFAMEIGARVSEKVTAAPIANHFEHRYQGQSIFRDGVTDARRDAALLVAAQDAVTHEFLQVADQHSLGNAGNTAAQLTGAHGAG